MSSERPPVRPVAANAAGDSHAASTESHGEAVVEADLVEADLVELEAAPAARRVVRHAAGLIGCAALLIGCLMLDTESSRVRLPSGAALPELCTLRRWTGVACPGCGLTRCFVSLSHGDLAAAWRYSPAGILFFALIVAHVPLNLVQLVRAGRGLPEWDIGGWTGAALVTVAALLIAQWVWRLL